MAWFVVAKMEYVVMEMVGKVVVKMGYLVEKRRGRRRWCGGGVMVVVVVGMEEEMEGRMVVELVEEVGGGGDGGWGLAGQGSLGCCWLLCWLQNEEEEEK